MPVSEKKLKANRGNAQKSTGPRTPEGKAIVAQNARKRYTTDMRLSPANEDGDFLILRLQLTNDLQPQGVMQEFMIERIATIAWKLRRLDVVESELIESARFEYEDDTKTDSEQEILRAQFDHDEDATIEALGKLLQAKPACHSSAYKYQFQSDSRAAAWLQRYELQLQRALHSALRQFERLQKREEAVRSDAPPPVDQKMEIAEIAMEDFRRQMHASAAAHKQEEELAAQARRKCELTPEEAAKPDSWETKAKLRRAAVTAVLEEKIAKTNEEISDAVLNRHGRPFWELPLIGTIWPIEEKKKRKNKATKTCVDRPGPDGA